jgi:hypothetical protein
VSDETVEFDEKMLFPSEAGATEDWGDDEFDPDKIRLNLAPEVAESESVDYTPIPGGKYAVEITKCVPEHPKTGENRDKWMYNLTYTIIEGKYKGRLLFDRVMLWEKAAYSLVQLQKALGMPITKPLIVPKQVDLLDRKFIARVVIVGARKVTDENGDEKTYEARNEVKGYFRYLNAANAARSKIDLEP